MAEQECDFDRSHKWGNRTKLRGSIRDIRRGTWTPCSRWIEFVEGDFPRWEYFCNNSVESLFRSDQHQYLFAEQRAAAAGAVAKSSTTAAWTHYLKKEKYWKDIVCGRKKDKNVCPANKKVNKDTTERKLYNFCENSPFIDHNIFVKILQFYIIIFSWKLSSDGVGVFIQSIKVGWL